MGTIITPVTVSNGNDPKKRISFNGFVDTGAMFLTLPSAWKEDLGGLEKLEDIQLELASGEKRPGEVCGPARVKIGSFREIFCEVLFMDMEPDDSGTYEPLIGYLPLETIPVGIDMFTHKLFKTKARAK